jgi:hypothetical protein
MRRKSTSCFSGLDKICDQVLNNFTVLTEEKNKQENNYT